MPVIGGGLRLCSGGYLHIRSHIQGREQVGAAVAKAISTRAHVHAYTLGASTQRQHITRWSTFAHIYYWDPGRACLYRLVRHIRLRPPNVDLYGYIFRFGFIDIVPTMWDDVELVLS